MFPQLMGAFDASLEEVVQFTGVCILVLGFSNFIWQARATRLDTHASTGWLQNRVPIQTAFGRRPVLILSTIICLASNIWRAVATSYGSFMGACILNGIGAGPAEVWNILTEGKTCWHGSDCTTTNCCRCDVFAWKRWVLGPIIKPLDRCSGIVLTNSQANGIHCISLSTSAL